MIKKDRRPKPPVFLFSDLAEVRASAKLITGMSNQAPPVIPTEIVIVSAKPIPQDKPVPIHPAAAMLLVVVDNLWNFADWAVIDWIVTIPASFLTVFFPVFAIQRRVAKDSVPLALGKAVLLGVVAAVPTSLTGTPVGLAFLAWAGFRRHKSTAV
jgi:hypothetical protein